MANAIEFDDVSKRYRIGNSSTLREAITAGARRLTGRRSASTSAFWSLRHVSFEVEEGAAIGLIGRNGAGKSTVLKILAGITAPTSGESRTAGRVAALLEVGTGFHPELTGRENVFLSGSILGMTRADIRSRFDDIVEFAGVGPFLDTPAKRFSSGMYLRLAFSVAAHLDPEVLVVDEILAVGDAEFQQRCLTRMHDAQREGRTVVFVSHDLEAVQRLCPSAIWIDGGTIQRTGPTAEVVRDYLVSSDLTGPTVSSLTAGPVAVERLRIDSAAGSSTTLLVGDDLSIGFDVVVEEGRTDVDLAVYLLNDAGVRILDEVLSEEVGARLRPGRNRIRLALPGILNAGGYSVGLWIGTAHQEFLDLAGVGRFTVVGGDPQRQGRLLVLRSRFVVESEQRDAQTSSARPGDRAAG